MDRRPCLFSDDSQEKITNKQVEKLPTPTITSISFCEIKFSIQIYFWVNEKVQVLFAIGSFAPHLCAKGKARFIKHMPRRFSQRMRGGTRVEFVLLKGYKAMDTMVAAVTNIQYCCDRNIREGGQAGIFNHTQSKVAVTCFV